MKTIADIHFKALPFLLFVFFVLSPLAATSKTAGEKKKDKKVTGEPQAHLDMEAEIPLPFIVNGIEVSVEVAKVTVNNHPQIMFVYTEPVMSIFAALLVDDRIAILRKTTSSKPRLTPKDFAANGMSLEYNQSGSVAIELPINWLKNKDINFKKKDSARINPNIFPSKFSGEIDLTGQLLYGDQNNSVNDNYLTTGVSLNAYGVIVNTGIKKNNQGAHRSETSLSYSFSKFSEIWLGDIVKNTADSSANISGIGFYKSADPAAIESNKMSDYIDVASASKISIYRNEKLLREFKANPGKVYINDLPIEIGNNVIRIVTTDLATGQKTERIIAEFVPIYGISKGQYSFYGLYGRARSVDNNILQYSPMESFSSGLRYGFTNYFTAGVVVKKSDYSGSLGFNESFTFANFSLGLIETRNIDILSSQNEYSVIATKSSGLPLLNNISAELKGVVRDQGDPLFVDKTVVVKSSVKKFLGISPSVGYESRHSTDGKIDDSFFVGLGHSFRFSRSWALSVSAIDSFSSKNQRNDFQINFGLSFSDLTDYSRTNFAISDDKSRRNTAGSLTWKGNSVSANLNTDKISKSSSSSISASTEGSLGTIQGSYSLQNRGSSYSLLGRTALFFAGNSAAIGKPSGQSFLIIKNQGKGDNFAVTNRDGDVIAENGFWNSAIVAVPDYSVESFNAAPKDLSEMFLDSTKSYAFGSERKTGGAVYFSSSNKIFVIAKVRDPQNKLAQNVELSLNCKLNEAESIQDLVADNTGTISFSAEKGSVCVLSSGSYKSGNINLDFMVKYKELKDIGLKKPKK